MNTLKIQTFIYSIKMISYDIGLSIMLVSLEGRNFFKNQQIPIFKDIIEAKNF